MKHFGEKHEIELKIQSWYKALITEAPFIILVHAVIIVNGNDESSDKQRKAAISSRLVPPRINTIIFFFFLVFKFRILFEKERFTILSK